ncbi:hypothetical protein KFL_006110070 [Klebsormidium nitens]|uniref:PH domain-containing protein n=1 Tax=Klebsormidium nitens TaxID=105231 RepID=A0A1Y1IH59_KLENI|nr:hypothetical protein KFL_006110070 [Klebsormidium nitens]|eukprot:GAQ90195.1 hypothetical protein KFL_006110070 [Klebsormidium nitens]
MQKQHVKRDISVEQVVASGTGLAGMSKEVIRCGPLSRKAKTQLKKDTRWVVLVPGKLLLFKPTLNGLEFQVSAPGTKTVTFEAASLEDLQSWLGAFDQAILAAIYELRDGFKEGPASTARGIVSNAATRASFAAAAAPAEPRAMSDPTPPKPPPMAPVLERSASAVPARGKLEHSEAYNQRPEPLALPPYSAGTPRGFGGTPTEQPVSPAGWRSEPRLGDERTLPQIPMPLPLKSPFLTADAQTPKTPTAFSPRPPLFPTRPFAAVSPGHTDISSQYLPAAKPTSVPTELADLSPEVVAAINAAAAAQAKATADGLVQDLASAETRAAHAEAMYKAIATAEGVASAAKAAAQAASEALAKAEAVSLATETSQRDALAGALARSSRTEQTLANLESAVEAKAAQGKSFAEMLAAAAAARGSSPTIVVNYNSNNTQNNFAGQPAPAVPAPAEAPRPLEPPVITEVVEAPESVPLPAENQAENASPTRNVKAMFTPGWAGVLGKKVPSGGESESGDSSTGTSPPGTGTHRDRRLAEYSDSDAVDSDWDTDSDSHREATPSPPRTVNVPGTYKPGGSLAAQLANRLARKEESAAASESSAGQRSEHVAALPPSPKSPTNPLAARVAQAAAASIIPPPEHFLTAAIETEVPSPVSPSSPMSAASSKGRRRASTSDDFEPSVPLTSAISPAEEPQLLKPSEMRGKAGLGSQRAAEETMTSAFKVSTSATSVAARAEAFQKIVDASAEKAPEMKKTWYSKHVSTSEGVYSPKTQFAQGPPAKRK